jgi:hypothetical protein
MGNSDSLADPVKFRLLIFTGCPLGIDQGLPCSLSYGFPCVSPLLPRKSIYRFRQLGLG